MAGFGQELRLERERRGASIEQMCAQTKVRPRHFEALEKEQYQELPGGVFRRGILRAYLASAGLEEEVWIPRFEASFAARLAEMGQNPEPQEEAWVRFAENVRRARSKKQETTRLRWIGVLALSAAIGASGWAIWFYELRYRLLH